MMVCFCLIFKIHFLVAAALLRAYFLNSHCIPYAVDAAEFLHHALAWLIRWSRVVYLCPLGHVSVMCVSALVTLGGGLRR